MQEQWRPRVKPYRLKRFGVWVFRWYDRAGRKRQQLSKVPLTEPYEEALRAAIELERQLLDGRRALTWEEAANRYEDVYGSEQAVGTQENWRTTRRAFERIVGPVTMEDCTTDAVDKFRSGLRRENLAPSTIAGHLRYLRAMIRWCHRKGHIAEVPVFDMPTISGTRSRSRPITGEEFDRILAAVPTVRPRDHERWQQFLKGLWHSGLRVSELAALKWTNGDVEIDLTQRFPGFRFYKQKNRDEGQWVPMTPAFFEAFVQNARRRRGYVFPLPGRSGEQMTTKSIVKVICDIGMVAGVRTSKNKFATSHDIGRRAFTTRHTWLSQWELAAFMRHESPETTKQFYVGDLALEVARKLWGGGDQAVTEAKSDEADSDELSKNASQSGIDS